MGDGLLDWVSELSSASAPTLNGVFLGTVRDNLDLTTLGRVQLEIPALPDITPWARVAAPFAGNGVGFYAMPQIGDEVLIAFERGDLDHAYVIGSLWSMGSQPPSKLPTEAVTKRVIKTPLGHTIELDDLEQTVTITTSTKQKVNIGPTSIELQAGMGTATITIGTDGALSLQSVQQISLSAPRISIDATAQLSLSGASASLQAAGNCTIQAPTVAIN